MKKVFMLLLAVVLSFSLFACGGKKDTGDKLVEYDSSWPYPGPIPANTNPNLKYFGYYHTDGFGGSPQYFSDIGALGNSNVGWITWSDSSGKSEVYKCKQNGMQAIVMLPGTQFFDNSNSSAAGHVQSQPLAAGYQSNWAYLKNEFNQTMGDGTKILDNIFAFYFDEPYWWGVQTDAFRTVTKMITDDYPTKHMMVCMTSMDIGASTYGNIPLVPDNYYEYCTDLGYDNYGVGPNFWNDTQRIQWLGLLKAKANNNQMLWEVPKAMEATPYTFHADGMIEALKGAYTEAITDKRFAGILCFSYATGINTGDWGYGLESFFRPDGDFYYMGADLMSLHIGIGQLIINNGK